MVGEGTSRVCVTGVRHGVSHHMWSHAPEALVDAHPKPFPRNLNLSSEGPVPLTLDCTRVFETEETEERR